MSNPCKLFVGNLAYNATNNDLYGAFCKFGTIDEAAVITDRTTSKSRGFGFVTFQSEAAATAAKEAMHEQELLGRRLTVRDAETKRTGTSGGGRFDGGGTYGGVGYGRGDGFAPAPGFGSGGYRTFPAAAYTGAAGYPAAGGYGTAPAYVPTAGFTPAGGAGTYGAQYGGGAGSYSAGYSGHTYGPQY